MPDIRTFTTYVVECDDCPETREATRFWGWTVAKWAAFLRREGWTIGRNTARCPSCASRHL